ncbi:papain-like cysteine protease family protein [Comamonas endophytica]|uniref:Uncharacterized protein n=1 Tax=Comamonas endophytica TaxID=2949090 RepID=A0ABY6G8U8_9BURK|nr:MULTISPECIES: papain-like cysteine protease family protein [unclassified Acidovorax]MCD2511729.1 hypothetical protein [Acidovorax sp. D4N7]UYG51455.1 hypothetical protein M9799_15555 [Acidovorax sp. 5MLIR]
MQHGVANENPGADIHFNETEADMSIAPLSKALTAAGAHQISSESLFKPLKTTLDKIINVITLGIYGAYKNDVASETKNALLDLGKALVKWNPDAPDIPVELKIDNRDYEISDMPNGGLRLVDCASGEKIEIDGVSLASMRDMILSDLMNHPDFSQAMEQRFYEDATVHVDFVGLKQERANACGEASRNMILAYHGVDYAPATNSRNIFAGIDKDELVLEMRGKGLTSLPLHANEHDGYTSEQIRAGLKNGPLLCELTGHFVIVHGVNTMFDRVDIFCPLLGNRSASLADFNSHLDWAQDVGKAPLTAFRKTDAHADDTAGGFGKRHDADSSSGIIDRLGVGLLATGFAIGNSWLKSLEDFADTM